MAGPGDEIAAVGKLTILNTNEALLCQRVAEGMRMAFDIVGLSLDRLTGHVHREMRGRGAHFHALLDAAPAIRIYSDIKLKIATGASQVNREDLLGMLVRNTGPDVWRLYLGSIEQCSSTVPTAGPGCLLISTDGTVFQATADRDTLQWNCLETPL
jgi:hypothetical protein